MLQMLQVVVLVVGPQPATNQPLLAVGDHMRVVAVHEERHVVSWQQLHPILEVTHTDTVRLWGGGGREVGEMEREGTCVPLSCS